MKMTNRDRVLESSSLNSYGQEMAEFLMAEDGLKIEQFLNLLGEMNEDIASLREEIRSIKSCLNDVLDQLSL